MRTPPGKVPWELPSGRKEGVHQTLRRLPSPPWGRAAGVLAAAVRVGVLAAAVRAQPAKASLGRSGGAHQTLRTLPPLPPPPGRAVGVLAVAVRAGVLAEEVGASA